MESISLPYFFRHRHINSRTFAKYIQCHHHATFDSAENLFLTNYCYHSYKFPPPLRICPLKFFFLCWSSRHRIPFETTQVWNFIPLFCISHESFFLTISNESFCMKVFLPLFYTRNRVTQQLRIKINVTSSFLSVAALYHYQQKNLSLLKVCKLSHRYIIENYADPL